MSMQINAVVAFGVYLKTNPDLHETSGVEVMPTSTGDDGCVICIRESIQRNSADELPLAMHDLIAKSSWVERIREYCASSGVSCTDPGWLLFPTIW
jgi:hypothetical protein